MDTKLHIFVYRSNRKIVLNEPENVPLVICDLHVKTHYMKNP